MEGTNNVRIISQKEASEIDANNVEYYTLTDGTIIHIKREGEEGLLIGNKNQDQQIIDQNQEIEGEVQQVQNQLDNQNAEIQASLESNQINEQDNNYFSNQYQQQSQIQTQKQILTGSKNQYQMNAEYNSNRQYKENREILQPGNNYGYYVSGVNRNISQKQYQTQKCTCNHNMAQGHYNAHLINAQIGQKYLISQLGLKNLALSGPQFFQQGQIRRKLYKLVEAYPIRIRNQNTDIQINSQQYNSNSYLIEKSNQNMKHKLEMNMNSQEKINQNNFIQNKTVQNASLSQRIEENNQKNEMNSNRFEQSEQMEDYCTCEQNHSQMQQEYQFQEKEYQEGEGEELNDQNIEYCNCELKYSEISQGKGNRAFQNKGECNAHCTCPIGNSGMKKNFEIINQESGKKE